jgi:hypothetical protein
MRRDPLLRFNEQEVQRWPNSSFVPPTSSADVTDSSLQLDTTDRAKRLVPRVPMFRSFNSSVRLLLRDGQTTQYASATDPVIGELTKIDVTLNVLK